MLLSPLAACADSTAVVERLLLPELLAFLLPVQAALLLMTRAGVLQALASSQLALLYALFKVDLLVT